MKLIFMLPAQLGTPVVTWTLGHGGGSRQGGSETGAGAEAAGQWMGRARAFTFLFVSSVILFAFRLFLFEGSSPRPHPSPLARSPGYIYAPDTHPPHFYSLPAAVTQARILHFLSASSFHSFWKRSSPCPHALPPVRPPPGPRAGGPAPAHRTQARPDPRSRAAAAPAGRESWRV